MKYRILVPLGLFVLVGFAAFAIHPVLGPRALGHELRAEPSSQLEAQGSKLANKKASPPEFRDGDILFQDMDGGQSEAIALATGSTWTHVGILFQENGEWLVYEAVGPVKRTPLNDWIAQGKGNHYVAKRWKEADQKLDASAVQRLRGATERFMGLDYDWQFLWSDSKIYCSELVWKLYDEGLGVELCAPKPMREHALDSELVQATMRERYGSSPPLDEPMVAPGALFDCPLLTTVAER